MTDHLLQEPQAITIPLERVELEGDLTLPRDARSLIVFAHGSGSSRHSPRNRWVAGRLAQAGFGTLLFDLLSREEEVRDTLHGQYRFDIALLAERLVAVSHWLESYGPTTGLRLGYFGASTGAAAALVAAAELPERVRAVVSRGGRPDLAGAALPRVRAATLLLVGSKDLQVLEWNRGALERLGSSDKQLVVVPRAGHLFEEPGTLAKVAALAGEWFVRHLKLATMEETSPLA